MNQGISFAGTALALTLIALLFTLAILSAWAAFAAAAIGDAFLLFVSSLADRPSVFSKALEPDRSSAREDSAPSLPARLSAGGGACRRRRLRSLQEAAP